VKPWAAGLLAACAWGQAFPPETDRFLKEVWPVMEAAQCRLCHNDNGVATASKLRFPPEGVSEGEIRAFSLRLAALVDNADPEKALLFQKPTARVAHTGGQRIKRGSAGEAALLSWVKYLSSASPSVLALGRVRESGKLPVTVRRLTHSQYNHTVRDLLGDQTQPANSFPNEDFVNGFTNQADGQGISPLQAEAYARAAERLARNAFRGGDARGLLPCKPASTGDSACAAKFIRAFGRRAFRRPLLPGEEARYQKLLLAEAKRTGRFTAGSQLIVEAMLQSPHFLFHLQEGGYRTASRLSYFLWDTMPDEWLLKQAEGGILKTDAGVRTTVEKMLADDRARASMDEFLAQWLRFDRLRGAVRDLKTYPLYSKDLASAMEEETRRLFRHLVWSDGDFREFFSADYTFVSSALAQIYGVQAPKEEFGMTKLPPESGRGGVVGHGSVLTLTSKPADTSPTERGLFVREHFLCQIVPPPPPGVDTTLPALTDEKPMTARQRLDVHLTNEACAACHKLVDPIGFGLEKYDAIGKFRDVETILIHPTSDEMVRRVKNKPTVHKLPIEGKGFVQGMNAEFATPRELGTVLANSPVCQRCVVKQLFRYAVGRPETSADQAFIDGALKKFEGSRWSFRELIIAVANSQPFLGGESYVPERQR